MENTKKFGWRIILIYCIPPCWKYIIIEQPFLKCCVEDDAGNVSVLHPKSGFSKMPTCSLQFIELRMRPRHEGTFLGPSFYRKCFPLKKKMYGTNRSCSINLIEDVFGRLSCQFISDIWTTLETSHHNAEMRGHQTGALKQWRMRITDHQSLTRNRLGKKKSKKPEKTSKKTHPSW